MKQHKFLARIEKGLWNDLTRVNKTLGNINYNSSINEGIRLFRDAMLEKISKQRRRRETLNNIF